MTTDRSRGRAGTPVTTQGTDTLVVEIDDGGALVRLAGVVGGAGEQTAAELVAIGPDALAVTVVTTGALVLGPTTFDTGVTATRAIAAPGIRIAATTTRPHSSGPR